MELIIKACPTAETEMLNSNYIFGSTADIPSSRFVRIRDTIYLCHGQATIEPKTICLNSVQRRTTGVALEDRVKISFVPADTVPTVTSIRWEIKPVRASLEEVDGKELLKIMYGHYRHQIFTENQQVGIEMPGNRLLLVTVREITLVKDSEITIVPVGRVSSETQFLLCLAADAKFRMSNLPEASRSANLFKSNFDFLKLGIGGLDAEFSSIFRRAFASRIFPPSLVRDLGITHVRGILLHGPPGTGKTLMARQIGKMLNCHEPIIISGPEVFNKWLGNSEEKVRSLFRPAEEELDRVGPEESRLHLIILDEFDSMCRQRGSVSGGAGVYDNIVNQLLAKMDGVTALPNILLIAMTNRKDLIEEAALRPGRFEVHIEVSLPDEQGRLQIFNIHTSSMRQTKHLAEDVSIQHLARSTANYSGAEIAGVVRAAVSHAMNGRIDHRNPQRAASATDLQVTAADFAHAMEEVRPQLGQSLDLDRYIRHGIIDYGPRWQLLKTRIDTIIAQVTSADTRIERVSILLYGKPGTGKTTVAVDFARRVGFPYLRLISADDLVGHTEAEKCNIIRKVFEDASRSASSVIILDDIERLVEYSRTGPRFSNPVLQTIVILTRRPPPPGKRLLVIGTIGSREATQDLEISRVFDGAIGVETLRDYDAMRVIMRTRGIELPDTSSTLEIDQPIKKVLLLADMMVTTGMTLLQAERVLVSEECQLDY